MSCMQDVCFGLGLLNANLKKKKGVLYCCMSLVPFMIKICYHVNYEMQGYVLLPTYIF